MIREISLGFFFLQGVFPVSFQRRFSLLSKKSLDFPGSSEGKGSAYNARDLGSIPESERSSREGNGNPATILAWGIPGTEEPGRLQSMGLQRIRHD